MEIPNLARTSDLPLLTIEAGRSVWLDLRELFSRWELVIELARVDCISKFRQTLLGPLWYLIQPLLTAFVFAGVFSEMAQVSASGIPASLFYLSGLMVWTYFSQVLAGVAFCLSTHSPLFKKLHFPRLAVPLSIVVSKLVPLAFQIALFLLGIALVAPNAYWISGLLALPGILLRTGLFALGAGLWLGALSVRYRDSQHGFGYLIQVWMLASPVLYPSNRLSPKWSWALHLNPLTYCIEDTRASFFAASPAAGHGYSTAAIAAVLISGVWIFQRTQRRCVDVL